MYVSGPEGGRGGAVPRSLPRSGTSIQLLVLVGARQAGRTPGAGQAGRRGQPRPDQTTEVTVTKLELVSPYILVSLEITELAALSRSIAVHTSPLH